MSVQVEGKSLVELLDMLEPAPEPTPVPMTPQTVGWVVLAVLLATAIAFGIYLYQRHRKSNAYRRFALADIEAAGDDVAKIAEILRRTAIAAYPREKVAGLYGQCWLNFLRQTSDKTSISDPDAQALIEAPYKRNSHNQAVAEFTREWVRSHKAEVRQR